MKSFTTCVAVLAVVLAVAGVQNAHAQLEVSLGAGFNTPMGEFSDQANTGYSLMADIGYRLMPYVAVGAELGYNGNGAPDEFTQALGPDVEMKTNMLQYAGLVRLIYPISKYSVFAKGAVGNYRGSATVKSSLGEASVNNTDLGFAIGAGATMRGGNNASFFVDVTRHQVTYEGATDATSFFTFNVGALFLFDFFNKNNLDDDTREELKVLRD